MENNLKNMENNLCCACLSKDRQIIDIKKKGYLIKLIHIQEVNTLNSICWECHNILLKFMNFNKRVKQAQSILSNGLKNNIKSLSNLGIAETKVYPDYLIIHNDDEFTKPDLIKQEEMIDGDVGYNDIIEDKYSVLENFDGQNIFAEALNYNETESSIDNTHLVTNNTHTSTDNTHLVTNTTHTSTNNTYLVTSHTQSHTDSKYLQNTAHELPKLNYFKSESNTHLNTNNTHLLTQHTDNSHLVISHIHFTKNNEHLDAQPTENTYSITNNTHTNTDNTYTDTKHKDKVPNLKDKQIVKTKKKKCEKSFLKINEDKEFNVDEQLNVLFDKIMLNNDEIMKVFKEKQEQANYKKLPFKCEHCVLGFTKQENYDIHWMNNHDEKVGPYQCKVCLIRLQTVASLERHQNRHYLTYKCRLCAYKTPVVNAALTHCRLKHSKDTLDRIHCKMCDFVVRTPEELESHVQSNHMVICSECGSKFKGKHTLRAHLVRVHSIKRPYSCDLCKKAFFSKSRLETHIITHGDDIAKKLAYCSLCKIQYKDIYVYRNHLRNSVNHVQDRFSCSVCNKNFASHTYLNKHYRFYHLKISNSKCEDCNKIFISKWQLKNHRQKRHGLTRNRNYECEECGKQFFNLSTLRTHKELHLGRRSFMCSVCGKTFNQRSALYAHNKRLHKNK